MSRIAEIKSKLKKIDGGFFREDLVYLLDIYKVQRTAVEVLCVEVEKLKRIREAAQAYVKAVEWDGQPAHDEEYAEMVRELADYEQAQKERGG